MIENTYKKMRCHDWKQAGEIMLWRYAERNRNYSGWHITTDKLGNLSLLALIDAMTIDGPGATRSIRIAAPTEANLRVPNCPVKAITVPSALRLSIDEDAAKWKFSGTSEYAQLHIGSTWLSLLRDGIRDIAAFAGDYSIGAGRDENQRLWFWR